ncbi:hypothetical protein C4K04_1390 [Pseudomonas chlororaphis]|uniref:Uncharacterized protein n=1 Tax=Pseudomonas chlororaphis TaxID=587753 RepID=A0A3G7TJB4_9PSED|nr:hypothetical protein C4K04_1390 [Pseudomonas chlororaphis]
MWLQVSNTCPPSGSSVKNADQAIPSQAPFLESSWASPDG